MRTATTTAPRRRAAALAKPREITLGNVAAEPTDPEGRAWAHAYRLGIRDAAQALGYHVIQRTAPWAPSRAFLCAVRETPREKRIIAEGLARYEAAARANPQLRERFGRID